MQTYLREEVLQEGLTRNIAAFSRFLEALSVSHAAQLNMRDVARECAVDRKTVEGFVGVLEDLLLAVRVPPFTKRATRRLALHPKLFLLMSASSARCDRRARWIGRRRSRGRRWKAGAAAAAGHQRPARPRVYRRAGRAAWECSRAPGGAGVAGIGDVAEVEQRVIFCATRRTDAQSIARNTP